MLRKSFVSLWLLLLEEEMKSYHTHFWFHPSLSCFSFFVQINTIDQRAIRLQSDCITLITHLHTIWRMLAWL